MTIVKFRQNGKEIGKAELYRDEMDNLICPFKENVEIYDENMEQGITGFQHVIEIDLPNRGE